MPFESSAPFTVLLDSSLRALAVALLVGAILAAARVRAGSLRHGAWTAVLVAMLFMPVLPRVVPAIGMPLATAMRAPEAAEPAAALLPVPPGLAAEYRWVPASPRVVGRAASPAAATSRVSASAPMSARIPWVGVLWTLYGSVVVVMLIRLAVGWFVMRRVLGASRPVTVAGASDAVLESSLVAVPLTAGIVSPRVVLPREWREWPDEKLRAVLAHEQAHVRRRDTLIAFAARVNRAVFWFHPLAWWLERALNAAAEQACDETAARLVATPRRYAELLLDIAATVRRRGSRVAWQGLGVDGSGLLGQRIDHLLNGDCLKEVTMRRKICIGLGSLAVILLVVACRAQQPPTLAPVPLKPDQSLITRRAQEQAAYDERVAAMTMTAQQVGDLEAALKRNPEDLAAREKLLGFYRSGGWQKIGMSYEDARAARLRHILWAIEHHPGDPIALYYTAVDPVYDPAGFAEVQKAWLAQTSRPGASGAVLSNAASFYQRDDAPLAEQLLLRLKAADPDGPQPRVVGTLYRQSWSARLGKLYARAVLGGDSPFAREARRKLDESNDAALLAGAAWDLGWAPEGGTSVDPQALAKQYIARAVALKPDSNLLRATQYQIERHSVVRPLMTKLWGVAPEKQAQIIGTLSESERLAVLPNVIQNQYLQSEFYEYQRRDKAKATELRTNARKLSEDVLRLADQHQNDRDRGAAILTAHSILGALALHDGDLQAALRHLKAAEAAPPSDGLKYTSDFLWSRLATGLLKRGERDAVVGFLDRLAQLNEYQAERLRNDAAAIRNGNMPAWYQVVVVPGTANDAVMVPRDHPPAL